MKGAGEADCPDDGESEGEASEDESDFEPETETETESESESESEDDETISHFEELREIRESPHYEDGTESRTLYQVDREIDFIEEKLLEMYIAMQENNILQ